MAGDRADVHQNNEAMEKKLKIKERIVVEGKYDKIKVKSAVDGIVLTTEGFRIFKDKEKRELLKRLAAEKGVIILTDSDGAGFKIRSYIKGFIDGKYIKNAFIPDVYGVEKRKSEPSKEGKLGVEGIECERIKRALLNAGVTETNKPIGSINKAQLYELGLLGNKDSAQKRKKLCGLLDLPERLSSNDFLEIINITTSYDKLCEMVAKINGEFE